MSGWASNSKWGCRWCGSAAQIVSYEIPNALPLFPGILLAGTLTPRGHPRAGRMAVGMVHLSFAMMMSWFAVIHRALAKAQDSV